jgi:hypothetical protein
MRRSCILSRRRLVNRNITSEMLGMLWSLGDDQDGATVQLARRKSAAVAVYGGNIEVWDHPSELNPGSLSALVRCDRAI